MKNLYCQLWEPDSPRLRPPPTPPAFSSQTNQTLKIKTPPQPKICTLLQGTRGPHCWEASYNPIGNNMEQPSKATQKHSFKNINKSSPTKPHRVWLWPCVMQLTHMRRVRNTKSAHQNASREIFRSKPSIWCHIPNFLGKVEKDLYSELSDFRKQYGFLRAQYEPPSVLWRGGILMSTFF